MSFCTQCDKDKSGGVWRLFLGWRNPKDAGKRKKDGYTPETPYAVVCTTCIKRVPTHAHRNGIGTLGIRSGRVFFLEKYTWDSGGTIGFHNSDYYPVRGSVFHIAAKDVSRFLPAATRAVRKADTERTHRLNR